MDFKDKTKSQFSFKKFKTFAIIAIVALFFITLFFTCWYTVDDKQEAVITTFGRVTATEGAGMHFKLPFGIQQAHIVDVNVFKKLYIGYTEESDNSSDYEVVEKESKMITGDFNIVNVDFFVEYKISDPAKYLFNSTSPETILKNLVQSQIRNVVGSTQADSVLTTGKTEIQQEIKSLVTQELEEYNIGVILTDIKIQDSEPPTSDVIAAYKNVETAKQGKETAINLAQAYRMSETPKAEAEVSKILNEANYDKQNRINEAKMQVSMFEAMYEQYKLNPMATKTRMYYEAMQQILADVKVFIDTSSDGSTQKLLPLDSLINNTGKATASEGQN